jgi:hypothetical protein
VRVNHRIGRLMKLAFTALLALPLVCPGRAGDGEDELKSATVLSFLRYSTWPETARTNDAFTVGVVGRPSFARILGGLLEGKSVNGRAVRLVELRPGADPRCCQLIYFATDKKSEIEPALQVVISSHALTIGEADRFLDYGGAVNLLLIDGHMGFEVNLDALERSGVDISSKLLRLGQIRRRHGA